jgi:hypothetical protein
MPLRTVKGIPRSDRKSDLTDAFVQQICATIDSPPRGSPHFRRVRVAISSYLGAEVAGIGGYDRRVPSSRHAVGAMVIGADGDSKVRSG